MEAARWFLFGTRAREAWRREKSVKAVELDSFWSSEKIEMQTKHSGAEILRVFRRALVLGETDGP